MSTQWASARLGTVARRKQVRTLLFKPCLGGIGDNLQWSHIPRIAKELGYDRVCLDGSAGFLYAARQIIWESNPYLDEIYIPGRYPPAPHIPPMWGVDRKRIKQLAAGRRLAGLNSLDWHMLALGLDDGARGHVPELYYKATLDATYVGKNVLDLNCNTSYALAHLPADAIRHSTRQAIRRLLAEHAMDYQIYSQPNAHYYVEGVGQKVTCDLFGLVNIIYSCASFNCIHSGPYFMAIAYGKKCRAVTYDAFVRRGDVCVRPDTELYLASYAKRPRPRPHNI